MRLSSLVGSVDKWTGIPYSQRLIGGVYHGKFLDPHTGQLLPWDEEKFIISACPPPPNVGSAQMLGCCMPQNPKP
jgi:hypothetical protein